jgi:hypothetical protein
MVMTQVTKELNLGLTYLLLVTMVFIGSLYLIVSLNLIITFGYITIANLLLIVGIEKTLAM